MNDYPAGLRHLYLFALLLVLLPAVIRGATAQEERPTSDEDAKPILEGGAPAPAPPFVRPPKLPPAGETGSATAADGPIITLWYGSSPDFGRVGDAQKWINIPGTLTSAAPLTSFNYTFNGGLPQPISLGPDIRRLAGLGDFNIELDYTDLLPGDNALVMTATDVDGNTGQVTATIHYQPNSITWTPGTYLYDWSTVTQIADLAQPVDGHWIIDNGTVRSPALAFDRLLAIGDLSWRDYTVTVPITFYGIDPAGYTAPSNGPGVGILVRWAGHYDAGDGITPVHGWRRLGALAWYKWRRNGSTYTEGLQLVGHQGRVLGTSARLLSSGVTYNFKVDVQSAASPGTPATYRFKVWPATQNEPAAWDLQSTNISGEPTGGSILLVAHHVDARFGPARVVLHSTRPSPTLTALTAGTGSGQVERQPAGPLYRFGEDVTLVAQPGSGSYLSSWSGGLTGSANPAVVALFENSTVTATFKTGSGQPSPTPTPVSGPCDPPVPGNPIRNPGFDDGTGHWEFSTNGQGTYTTPLDTPYRCRRSGRVTIGNTAGSTAQLYQAGVPLLPNTAYRLRFAARSSTGRNAQLYLQRHTLPNTNYGLSGASLDLTNSWKVFEVNFTTRNFTSPVIDGRLRFVIGKNAAPREVFQFDDVVLLPAGGSTATATPSPTTSPTAMATNNPTTTPTPTATATGMPPPTATPTATTTTTPTPTSTAGPITAACDIDPATLIRNPGFESGPADWKFYSQVSGNAFTTTTEAGYPCGKFGQVALNKTSSNIQLYQSGFAVQKGTRYRLRFEARANGNRNMAVYLQMQNSPYTNLGLAISPVALTTGWQTFDYSFTATGSTSNARLRLWLAGISSGSVVQVDNVALTLIP